MLRNVLRKTKYMALTSNQKRALVALTALVIFSIGLGVTIYYTAEETPVDVFRPSLPMDTTKPSRFNPEFGKPKPGIPIVPVKPLPPTQPTQKPTPRPTPMPTPRPTPIATPIATPKPTPRPTPKPTPMPTKPATPVKVEASCGLEGKIIDESGTISFVQEGKVRWFSGTALDVYRRLHPTNIQAINVLPNTTLATCVGALPRGAPMPEYLLEGKPVSLNGHVVLIENGKQRWFSWDAWQLYGREHPEKAAGLITVTDATEIAEINAQFPEGVPMPETPTAREPSAEEIANVVKSLEGKPIIEQNGKVSLVENGKLRWFSPEAWANYQEVFPSRASNRVNITEPNQIAAVKTLPLGQEMQPLTFEGKVVSLDGNVNYVQDGKVRHFDGDAWALFRKEHPEEANQIVTYKDPEVIEYINRLPRGVDMPRSKYDGKPVAFSNIPVTNSPGNERVQRFNNQIHYVQGKTLRHFSPAAWNLFLREHSSEAQQLVTITDAREANELLDNVVVGPPMPERAFNYEGKVVEENDGKIVYVEDRKLRWFSPAAWDLYKYHNPQAAERRVILGPNDVDQMNYLEALPKGPPMPIRSRERSLQGSRGLQRFRGSRAFVSYRPAVRPPIKMQTQEGSYRHIRIQPTNQPRSGVPSTQVQPIYPQVRPMRPQVQSIGPQVQFNRRVVSGPVFRRPLLSRSLKTAQ